MRIGELAARASVNPKTIRLDDLDRRIDEMQRARQDVHALLQRAADLPDDDRCYCQLIEHEQAAVPGV